MANAPKPTTVKKESSTASNLFATLVIPICIPYWDNTFHLCIG
jgi:biopolymer transport protein ExbB